MSRWAIGIDLGGTGIKAAVIGVGFAPQLRDICARQRGQRGIEERVGLIHAAYSTFDMSPKTPINVF